MAGPLDRPMYTPQPPGNTTVDQWAYREFIVLSQAFGKPPGWYLDVVNIPPTRPRDGLLAFADGTNWNPGQGKGLYIYSAAFQKLLTSSSVITNAMLATMPAWTIKGNVTSGVATPTDFTIDGLTLKSPPVAADELILWDVVGSAIKKVAVSSFVLNPGAWTSYTPSFAPNTGAFTTASASGRWVQLGKTIHFSINLTITTNGTGAGFFKVGLPIAVQTAATAIGRETNGVTGKVLGGTIQAGNLTMIVLDADNAYPGANGTAFTISGTYETT